MSRNRGTKATNPWLDDDMTETNLIAIVGSLRSGSVNRAVARAAIALTPDTTTLSIHPIADLPLYNGDVEARGLPDSVQALHDAVAGADGVIFFTPEYNSSIPAVTKNAIDWLSRPPTSLEGKPFAAVSTTPGGRAGAGVLGHIADIYDHMADRYPRFESLGIGGYPAKLDEAGELADADTRAELADWLARFVDFASQR